MTADDEAMAAIKSALTSDAANIRLVRTFTHGRCVQVYDGRRKAGPVLVSSEGQTVADLLTVLGTLVLEVQS